MPNTKNDPGSNHPGRSTSPNTRAIITPDPGGGALSGRLKCAVWTWRLRVPHGRAGRRYLAALDLQLAAHIAFDQAEVGR
jgi:hypothetical protein